MAVAGASSAHGQTFVKRAAALRDKCRVCDLVGSPNRRLPPDLVASHPLNRNGVRLNGHQCEELFRQVLRTFVVVEACHGVGCVEALFADVACSDCPLL